MAAGALAVGPAAREQLAADAAALQGLGHPEEREAPDALADSASADALDAAVALGHPGSAGIGAQQMADARVLARRAHGLELAVEGRVEDLGADAVGVDHVLVAHGADVDLGTQQ